MATLVQRVMTFLLSLYYGTIVTYQLVKLCFSHGPGFVFGGKTHSKPAALSDPSLGTHGFLHLEQVRIHYVASGPEDKPLMLFLHGFPEFWFSWRHQIKEFQKDYRCVAIDMRGHGESDKPLGIDSYHMTTLLTDIKQVIQALGYESCILVAHDWGGVIAWPFARLYPDLVDKLIVMNAPAGPASEKVFAVNKQQLTMSWYIFLFQLPYFPELVMRSCDYSFFERMFGIDSVGFDGPTNFTSGAYHVEVPREQIEAYKFTYSQPGVLTSTINFYRANILGEQVRYDLDYPMPCLLIWGMNDVALHHDHVTTIEQMNPNISVRRIEEACHFVHMDSPVRVNQAMREWLSEQAK